MAKLGYLGPRDFTEQQLVEWLKEVSPPIIAIDTETVSLKDRTVIGVGVAVNEKEAVYFPTWPELSPYTELLWRLLASPAIKVFHNTMYDLYGLVDCADIYSGSREFVGPVRVSQNGKLLLADTALKGQIQALPESNLQYMSRAYLGEDIESVQDILPARHKMTDLDERVVARKCMRDCLATFRLERKLGNWLDNDGHAWSYKPNWEIGWDPGEPTSYYITPQMKDCYRVDLRLIPLLTRMSQRGIALRQQKVFDWFERLSKEKLYYEDICSREFFNPGSQQQVGLTLAKRGNILPFTDRSMKRLKVDKSVLSELSDPLAVVVLKHREVSKILSTYLKHWLGQERAYFHFKMEVATGRLASYDDNGQNIPAPLRSVFEPDNNAWTSADASEIEMRMIAYASQDQRMLKVYREGGSVHANTQMALWPNSDPNDKAARVPAKTFGFAMSFGADDDTLHEKTRLPIETCREYREIWRAEYPEAYEWIVGRATKGVEVPYTEDIFGRRSRLPRLAESTPKHRSNCAVNYIPQGSAASAVKRAMLVCEGLDQALQVHDEILVDGVVRFPLEEMATAHPGIRTPFKTTVSLDWG